MIVIEVPVPSQEKIRPVCVSGIDFTSVSTSFLLGFGTVPTVWFFFGFFFFILFQHYHTYRKRNVTLMLIEVQS